MPGLTYPFRTRDAIRGRRRTLTRSGPPQYPLKVLAGDWGFLLTDMAYSTPDYNGLAYPSGREGAHDRLNQRPRLQENVFKRVGGNIGLFGARHLTRSCEPEIVSCVTSSRAGPAWS
jgi:hypothetical protein